MKNHFMFSYYIQVNIQFFSIAFKNFQNLKLPFNLMTHYLQFSNYVMLFLFSLPLHLLFILWEKCSKIHYLCNSPQVVRHFLNTKHLKENHYYFKNSYYFVIWLFIYFPQLCSFLEFKILNRGLLAEASITLTPKNGCEPSSKPRDGIHCNYQVDNPWVSYNQILFIINCHFILTTQRQWMNLLLSLTPLQPNCNTDI